jgi:hypothetical protein
LFGNKNELFVVHNMGKLLILYNVGGWFQWDISSFASFVVASPNAPDVQENFATERKWRFDQFGMSFHLIESN